MHLRFIVALAIFATAGDCADFTTYIGGSSLNQFLSVTALAADAAGDTYATGGELTEPQASRAGFLTKLDPAGNVLYTVALADTPNTIAVDPSGNVWLGGSTSLSDFPLMNPLQSAPSPRGSGFLTKFSPSGTLLYSSYFGGVDGASGVNGVATDAAGNLYVTGVTSSSDFSATSGLPSFPPNASTTGAFVAKLDPTGQKIVYATVIAGTRSTCLGTGCTAPAPSTTGSGIAVDGAGDAVIAGATNTVSLGGPQGESAPGTGPFVVKINAAGDAIVYLTYLSPAPSVINDVITSSSLATAPIAADASGHAYVLGSTNIPDFPATPGAYQTTYTGGAAPQGFVTLLGPEGQTVWTTFLPFQPGPDSPYTASISLDSASNVWLTGAASAEGIGSVTGSGTPDYIASGFVSELSADGSRLPYSSNFPAAFAGQDIAVDSSGVVHLAGPLGLVSTLTAAQPNAPRVLSILNAAAGQVTGVIAPGEIISIHGSSLGR